MNLDLTDEETAALLRELDGIIDGDRYFLSERTKTLKAIRAKIRPEPFRAELANEKPKLENDVLPRALVQIDCLLRLAQIVRGHQHHGKPHPGRFLAELRDERASFVR